jgi:hypothetical protein
MTGKYFSIICAAVLAASQCVAQSNNSQIAANWGQSIQGVQLAIMMTNGVFQVGSSSSIVSVTENSSTNAIIVDMSAPTVNFDVLLTNDTGKLYHVTTPMMIRGPRKLVAIQPGEKSVESIPVTFREEIEPGDYTLKATRTFTSNDGDFTLESNSIKVQIIK